MKNKNETKPENLWIGRDRDTGQLWLYDPFISEDRYSGSEFVDLFKIENDYGFEKCSYAGSPGELKKINRQEYRKKLDAIKDENIRKVMIDAYLKWFRYQDYYGNSSPIDSGPGFSDALSDRIYINPRFNSDS